MDKQQEELIAWAKREAEIAKVGLETELPRRVWNMAYDKACDIYSSIILDNGGPDYRVMFQILTQLMANRPLTPIEERDDIWGNVTDDYDGLSPVTVTIYQCNRWPTLFKRIYSDGRVEYRDHNRLMIFELPFLPTWHTILFRNIEEAYFPIKFPYTPERFLIDFEHNSRDDIWVKAIRKIEEPWWQLEINRGFRRAEHQENGDLYYELTKKEYDDHERL